MWQRDGDSQGPGIEDKIKAWKLLGTSRIPIKSYPRGGVRGDFFLSITITHMEATRMNTILEKKKLRFRDRANKTEQRESEMSVLAGGIQHGKPEMDGLPRPSDVTPRIQSTGEGYD